MPSQWSWVALGAGAYVAFVLSSVPAATALRWFAPPELDLVGVEGTIWAGSAAAGAVAGLAVRDVHWRLRPWPLLLGRVGADVDAQLDDGFVEARVAAAGSSVRLSDLRASTSLPTLRRVLPIQGMQGLASATLAALELRDGWPTRVVGVLRLAQLQAEPLMPIPNVRLVPLGDYEVRFNDSEGAGIAAEFRDTGGPLEVTGTLTLDLERRYTLDALVEARPNAPQPLVEGLAAMTSEPDAEGRRRLEMTGTL